MTISLRILVVEDNKSLAQITKWTMEALGHEVELAYDGISAVEKALALIPDAILLDIGLPKMNGFEVCQTLRKHPALDNTIIVAQTGYSEIEYHPQFKEAGFNYHFVKPVDLLQLQQLLMQQNYTHS